MANKKQETVTLKRNVTVKAIVTDEYKKFLITELNRNVVALEKKLEELDKYLKSQDFSVEYKTQVQKEKKKTLISREALLQKVKATKALKEGEVTTQGRLEGMTSVTLGDNLYNKIGAMEILIKDGIVKDISVIDKVNINE